MTERRHVKHAASLEQRLADRARLLREQAKSLRPGPSREAMLRKARQADTAAFLTAWVNSPGLEPPE